MLETTPHACHRARCQAPDGCRGRRRRRRTDEAGSLVTEYGLLAVVAATVAGVLIRWATGGAVVDLFNALIARTRELVGA
jgi:Flp pilus assembly pilin Flp